MASNEATLVKSIERAIRHQYPKSWVFKVVGSPYQMTGVPDLVAVVMGRFFGLEVKHQKPGESLAHALSRASPAQLLQIRLIEEAGGYAGVVTTVEDALEIIERGLKLPLEETHHHDHQPPPDCPQ